MSTYYGQVLQKELGYEAPAEKMPKIVSLRYSKNKWSAFATYLDRRFFRGLDTRAIGAGFHLNEGEVFQTGIKVSTLAEIWSMTELTPVGTGQITNSFYVYPEISWKVFAIGQLASESKRTFGSTAGSTRRQLTTKLSIKANDFLRLEAENTKRWEEFDRGSRIQLGNELTARILVEIENSSKSSL
ncbi:MAG: hypothetical protein KDD35_09030 [Bdellovibrionales bacterium]|nr:hypothetical protein [Bdellovibrionales bacterium]